MKLCGAGVEPSPHQRLLRMSQKLASFAAAFPAAFRVCKRERERESTVCESG